MFRVLGITALVYVVGTILGVIALAFNGRQPAIPVDVENLTGEEIEAWLVGSGCERPGLRIPAGEEAWLYPSRPSPLGCEVVALSIPGGREIARVPVVRRDDGSSLPKGVRIGEIGRGRVHRVER